MKILIYIIFNISNIFTIVDNYSSMLFKTVIVSLEISNRLTTIKVVSSIIYNHILVFAHHSYF